MAAKRGRRAAYQTRWTVRLLLARIDILRDFARMALHMADGVGTVALLLRLNWLGSQDRAPFHRAHPADIYILPKRPEFAASLSCTAKKSGCTYKETLPIEAIRPKICPLCGAKTACSTTDSIEYAWFVWGPSRGGRWSILPMPTPSRQEVSCY